MFRVVKGSMTSLILVTFTSHFHNLRKCMVSWATIICFSETAASWWVTSVCFCVYFCIMYTFCLHMSFGEICWSQIWSLLVILGRYRGSVNSPDNNEILIRHTGSLKKKWHGVVVIVNMWGRMSRITNVSFYVHFSYRVQKKSWICL
jgi:hypothetical protein